MRLRVVLKGFLLSILFIAVTAVTFAAAGIFVKTVYCLLSGNGTVFILAERIFAAAAQLAFAVFYILVFADKIEYDLRSWKIEEYVSRLNICSFIALLCMLIRNMGVCFFGNPGVKGDVASAVVTVLGFYVSFCICFFTGNKNWIEKTEYSYILFNPTLREKELVRIALKNPYADVRERAAKRIQNQTILAEIVQNDKDPYVRRAALRNVTDQSVINYRALNDENADLRKEAAERVSDQSVLAEIALTDPDAGVRKTAAERVSDQTVLSDISLNDKDANVRKEAVSRLKDQDQDTLVRIALNDTHSSVRIPAIQKLTDAATLQQVIARETNENNYTCAVQQLKKCGSFDAAALQSCVDNITNQLRTAYSHELYEKIKLIYKELHGTNTLRFAAIHQSFNHTDENVKEHMDLDGHYDHAQHCDYGPHDDYEYIEHHDSSDYVDFPGED